MSTEKASIIAVGIDVGGTHTRLGVVNGTRKIIATRRCETVRDDNGGALLNWLVQAVDETLGDVHTGHHDAVPIGLALPGILDRDRQVVERSVSLPFLEHRPIVEQLAERTVRPVRLVTDAEAATWGEYISRCPRSKNFVHLRLGTGLGCGAVVDGQLQRLDLDRTGHLAELVIADALDTEGAPQQAADCPCGKRGCLETIAAGPALSERAADAGLAERFNDPAQLSTADQSPERKRRVEKPRARAWGSDKHQGSANGDLLGLQLAWEQEDPSARAIVDVAANAIAIALANLAKRFDPNVICIGGGVATACPCLVAEAKQRFVEIQTPSTMRPVVESAILADNAGIVGAALLASEACCGRR